MRRPAGRPERGSVRLSRSERLTAPILTFTAEEVWRQTGSFSAVSYVWVSVVQVLLAALFLRSVLVHLDRNLRRLAVETGRTARQVND